MMLDMEVQESLQASYAAIKIQLEGHGEKIKTIEENIAKFVKYKSELVNANRELNSILVSMDNLNVKDENALPD